MVTDGAIRGPTIFEGVWWNCVDTVVGWWHPTNSPGDDEMAQAKRKHFHIWESGDKQVFSPIESVIGYLRNEHHKTISDISNERCFAVLDAIGILCDLENGPTIKWVSYPELFSTTERE